MTVSDNENIRESCTEAIKQPPKPTTQLTVRNNTAAAVANSRIAMPVNTAAPPPPSQLAISYLKAAPPPTVSIQLPHESLSLKDDKACSEVPQGTAGWITSFERLLEDPAGLQTFAEFLKKEFSAENIYFWTACERLRLLENDSERAAMAQAIFAKHLSASAPEPVNVDSQARNLSEERLQSADCNIFTAAQKQIFNLMKFDSYQRFMRSELYKSCVEAEEKQLPLPYSGEDLDELLRIHAQQDSRGAASKLKKSASNAEDRRRKSLLPWHRKTRSKSRDRNIENGIAEITKTASNSQIHASNSSTKIPMLLASSSLKIPNSSNTNHNSLGDLHSSRSSLSSFDATAAVALPEAASTRCRFILSDGATTIVQTKAEETVGQLVDRLLEKRGLCYQFYDVIANGGSSKSIDLQSSSQILAGKEVLIEQRVAFKLDLPDPKVISVKSKLKKQLHEVIRPILSKYKYEMEAVDVLVKATQLPIDLYQPVAVVDGLRLQVKLKPSAKDYQNDDTNFAKPIAPAAEVKQMAKPSLSSALVKPVIRNGVVPLGAVPQAKLDELTNKVFNELLQGKVAALSNQKIVNNRVSDDCSLKSDDCASEASSIFDRMRRRDVGIKIKSKKKSTSSQYSDELNANSMLPATTSTSNCTNAGQQAADVKKPIIAKLKAGVKLQLTERVSENQEELLESLKRAQLTRLNDQRGTEINFELPEFLKNKDNINAAASKLRKMRASLSPVHQKQFCSEANTSMIAHNSSSTPSTPTTAALEFPQPAPRLSISNRQKATSVSPMKIDEEQSSEALHSPTTPSNINCSIVSSGSCASSNSNTTTSSTVSSDCPANIAVMADGKGPPPLPPKPKVLPIKPSNWGIASTSKCNNSKLMTQKSGDQQQQRCAYLEEPSSSFV